MAALPRWKLETVKLICIAWEPEAVNGKGGWVTKAG
jgi:hypothetical protein